ncbi:MAG: rhomboid family intramembrane serine protease [Nanoarchaeota archaeon]|nr:rhomboid family intramembrane serine protease [Nanoarchaeota archaeon]MBU1103591.1 rhomboid family intramembrane serine protease [Nanoarchaeota archaeon]
MNYYQIRKKKRSSLLQKVEGFSVVTWLIIINIIFSITGFIFFGISEDYISYLALKPENILQGKYLWTLITHMFVHGGVFHLFVNMFSLFFIGRWTEKIIGGRRFFWFYFAAGLFAVTLTTLLSVFLGTSELGMRIFGSPEVFMVGASGAIFGLVGILSILIPKSKVSLIFGPLVVIVAQIILEKSFPSFSGIINVISTVLIFGMIIFLFSPNNAMRSLAMPITISLWMVPLIAIVPLVLISLFIALPIGNVAHFGGFLAGIIYGLYLKTKYKKKVQRLQKMFR